MALLREFYAPFVDASPGMAGMGDCESLTRLRNRRAVAEVYPARHFWEFSEPWAMERGRRSLVTAKVESGTAPLLRLLQPGLPRPVALRLF